MWTAFNRYAPPEQQELSTGLLYKSVLRMREAAVKPKSCNTYISAINAFLHWLYDMQLIPRRISAPLLKVDDTPVTTVNEKQLQQLVNFKSKTKGE